MQQDCQQERPGANPRPRYPTLVTECTDQLGWLGFRQIHVDEQAGQHAEGSSGDGVREVVKSAERADRSIKFRITNAQKRILAAAAAKAGLGLSAWLRELALREACRLGVK